jgi:hypothetical protein
MILVHERRSGVLGNFLGIEVEAVRFPGGPNLWPILALHRGTSNAQRGILTVDTGKWAGVIWSGSRCERVRLPDNEQGRFREFWPELSYLAYWLIAVRSPRSPLLR